jgi:hypothetical protein
MPTAVERLADLLQNVLKLDAIDSPAAETGFPALDGEIDPGLAALNTAATPDAFAAAERQYRSVFATLGDGAAGLGADLQRDAVVFDLVDWALGGFGDGGGSGRTFARLDVQLFDAGGALETFGADFARLGRVGQAGLGALETKLQADATTLAGDFDALAGDLTAFLPAVGGGVTATATTTTPTLAGVLGPVVGELTQIGADFGSLAGAFGGGGSGVVADVSGWGTTSSGGNHAPAADVLSGGGAGQAFANLQGDFLTLDASLQQLGTPLANLLLPAVTPPTVS